MPRNITVTFSDGSSHVYQGAPDTITPADVQARAAAEFSGKTLTNIDGGAQASPPAAAPAPVPAPSLSDEISSGIQSAASAVSSAAGFVADGAKYYAGQAADGIKSALTALTPLAQSGEAADGVPEGAGLAPAPPPAAPVDKLTAATPANPGPLNIPAGQPWMTLDSEKSPARIASEQAARTGPQASALPISDAEAARQRWTPPQGTLQAGWDVATGHAGQTLARAVGAVGDAVDSSDLRDLGRGFQAAADQRINQAMQGNEQSDAVKTMAGVFSLAPLLAGNVTGLATMVTQAGIDGYGDARQAGDSPAQAIARGTAMALANYVGLRTQLPGITGALEKVVQTAPAGEAIAALGHAITTNVGGMEATTALSDLYDKMAPGGLRPDMTASDMVRDIADTAKSATLLSLAVPGIPLGAGHLYGAAHALAHGDRAAAARNLNAPAPAAGDASAAAAPDASAPTAAPAARGDASGPPIGLDTLHDSIDETAAKVGLSPAATVALRDAAAQQDPQNAAGFIARVFHRYEANGLTTKPGAPGAFRDFLSRRLAAQQPEEAAAPAAAPPAAPSVADQLAAVRPAAPAAEAAEPPPAADEASDAAAPPAAPVPITPTSMAQANDIAAAAHDAATSPFNDRPDPTDAQKAAGNYAMGHVQLHGLDVTIENPQGSTRSGVDPDGKPWSNEMAAHYGYIKGTSAADGDHVDTFIGPNPESKTAYVIDQVDPSTGKFDEPKTILGADSEQQARELYAANYADGWNGLGAITALPMDAFKSWVRDGVKDKPLGDITQWKPTDERAQPDVAEPADLAPGAGDAAGDQPGGSGGDLRSAPDGGDGRGRATAAAPVEGSVGDSPVARGDQSDSALNTATPTWDSLKPGDQVTLYRGEGEGNEAGGQWWTTSREKAERYGHVESVTLPAEVAAKHAARGHNGADEFVFPGKRPPELARSAAPRLLGKPVDEWADERLAKIVDSAAASGRARDVARAELARRTTDTPDFKKWFSGSKVVDESGQPQVMFHGTNKTEGGDAFSVFDAYGSEHGLFGQGSYFTADPKIASDYTTKGKGSSPTVYPVHLAIKNPIDMDAAADPERWRDAYPEQDLDAFHQGGATNESWFRAAEDAIRDEHVPKWEGAEMMQEGLRKMGYDGITHVGGGRIKGDSTKHRVYIAFDPEQVKSAIGNRGTFDPESADIRTKQTSDKPPTKGVDPVALRSEVGRIQAGWKDAPPVHVVDDVNGLPQHIQDSLRSMGAEGKTRALLMPGRGSDPGDVYLIANRLRDVPMAQAALFHEVLGHYGIRKVLGSDAVYSAEMYKLRQANPALAREAEAWMQAHGRGAIADRMARGLTIDQAMKVVRALSTEEALADRAGKGEPIRGLQKLMAKIQQWLRSVGLHSVADRLESMTQAETAALLAKARSTVEASEPSTYHGDEFAPALSEGDGLPVGSTMGADDKSRASDATASAALPTDAGGDRFSAAGGQERRGVGEEADRGTQAPLLSQPGDSDPEIRQIGDKWAIVHKAVNGGENHDYYDSKAAALSTVAERSARTRLEANRAAGAHAAWWADDRTEFVQSTGQRRLDSATRERVTQQTLDARRESVSSPAEASALRQIPSREGFCFKVAAEASAHGIGDMVIGATHAPDGSAIWHAVVTRDGMVYDPTFGRWFKPGLYERMGFEPKLTLSSQEVQEFIQKSGGFAPDARNQGLGDAPSGSGSGQTPLLSQHAADDELPKAASGGSKVAAAMAKVREAGAKIADTGRQIRDDALLKTAPMALGDEQTRTIAKDFANADRLARWQWGKFDDILAKNYDEAQRKEMWEAADQENVLRQQDKTPGPEKGLNRLTPDQRATMDTLHNYGEELLQRAKDVGMFQGEGLPYWTPRMAVMIGDTGEYQRPKGAGAETGAAQGRNIVTSASSLKARKHLTAEETEAAMKGKLGDGAQLVRDIRTMPLAMARLERAIAGRDLVNDIKAMGQRAGLETVSTSEQPGFFTVDHPAFKTWQVTTGEDGSKTWEAKPLYINKAFQGPLKAVMSETPGPLYSALMSLKGKSMGLIMYSPLIHNAVEWGRALPAMPGKVATFQIYFEGNRIKNDPEQMRQAIKDGLVPIGRRGGIQDITGIMEDPTLKPGRSWTAKLIGGALGLASEKAGTAAKKGIDAAGDFWHNTLLWDRVGDLQAGLYGAIRDKEIAGGMAPEAAGKLAAHFANRFAGALPNEAMSAGARKVANLLMFSRTFTLGNMGLMKDMISGLPRDIQSQIKVSSGELVAAAATSRARRMAIASFVLDMGLMYLGNSLMQDAIKKLRGEKSLGEIGQGYADRLHKLLQRVGDHPLETLSNPFDVANSLSSTSENEPGKEDRIRVGTQEDGTAIYMRLPTGKVGEDFKNWITKPLITAKAKESQLVRPLQAVWNNDNGIGQRIYDPDAKGLGGVLANAGRIAKLFATQMVPTDAIQGALDWKNGKASNVDKLKVAGPLAGLTFSKGAPGGPEVGAMYDADRKFLGAKMDIMPSVKQAIKDGDDDKAIALMQGIKMSNSEINSVLRRLKSPESRMSAGSFRNFSKHASDEDMQRMMDLLKGEQSAKSSREAAPAAAP